MTAPLAFLHETLDELKKVTFPTQQEATRLTIVVLVTSLIVGLYIGGLDFIFTNLTTLLIK